MTNIIYILIAAVIAILLAAFFYLYKAKNNTKSIYLLFGLRALAFFAMLLLFLNLKINKRIIKNIKPKLMVLVDNSESIAFEKQDNNVRKFVNEIQSNPKLNEKYQIEFFTFGENLKKLDSLKFNQPQTNISKALSTIKNILNKQQSSILLLSDGNQTLGNSYVYFKSKAKVFPVIFGDTSVYQDVYIDQLNANKYAYLKHQFPVEVYAGYKGKNKNVPVQFSLYEGNKKLYSKQFSLGDKENSKHFSFYLPAKNKGIHHYKAIITSLPKERNTINNSFYFSVNVISEQSKTLLITSIIHPDIAMLKRAIESNEQRKLIIKKPTDKLDLDRYKNVILYQPQANFKVIYNQLVNQHKNIFFITGSHTNWKALNTLQNYFKREEVSKNENYNAIFNQSFHTFLVDDIGFKNFPPVQDKFGELKFNVPFETLLFQQINSFKTDQPLMATFSNEKQRFIAFFGENSWRWRLYNYKDKKQFKDFDTFINKIIQYLDAQKEGDLLKLKYKKNYFSNQPILITAQVFDVNYHFNPNKKLWIKIGTNNNFVTYPFALKNNFYEVQLTDLKPGIYRFSVYDNAKTITKSGSFSVLNYSMEQQNLSGNLNDLKQLAQNNNGKVFFSNQSKKLQEYFQNNNEYHTIQSVSIDKKDLIDWKLLLGIIILLLSFEWFIRKYKGFI